MKIKTFNPFILAKNSEATIKLFEGLGFEKTHVKADANSGKNPATRMKNADGFHVDIAQVESMPQDVQAIRVNVDDFDAAYQELTAMGFVNMQGERIAHSSSDEACMMASPTGFMIMLCKHIVEA